TAYSQYFQNFDTLSYGDYIGVKDPAWTTWSNTPGSSEDAKVDTVKANSPNNSIYFIASSPNGGPQDAVLEFGAAYTTGIFEYQHSMYIVPGKGAYFNFQAETTIGTTWALNCHFIQDSLMYIDDATNVHISTKYPVGTWFSFELKVNLNTNIWEIFIDSVSKGSWQNAINKIASIDIFPYCIVDYGGNGISEFWIDDVGFNYTAYTLPTINAAVTNVGFEQVTIAGLINKPVVKVRNLGTTTITSFDLLLDYNSIQTPKSVTNVSIPSLGLYEVKFTPGVTIVNNVTSITASITAVNGSSGDGDSNDDSKTLNFTPIVPAQGKVVIVEEATGTWCGWCPRGTVAMDFLARDYHGIAAGIAVHNSDPMEDSIYDAGVNTYITGYPSALVERGIGINPATIWSSVEAAVQTPPTAFLHNGARYNSSNNLLEVSISVDFKAAATSNWKMACVLVEDSVTGTGSGYNQTNSYAGGLNGPMIGPNGVNWANLPSSVPASQMVYNHVARAISPSFAGYANGFPATVTVGSTHTINFSFHLSTNWDTANMHIVGMLIKPNGRIDNGSTSTIAEALANGFISGVNVSVTEILPEPDTRAKVYPNPVSDILNIELSRNYETIVVEVRNTMGQIVSIDTEYSVSNLKLKIEGEAGVYFVSVLTSDDKREVFKVVKQ
ncbi:Omp28-related outer membrane protein, partial [Bacteroidota bacterium]